MNSKMIFTDPQSDFDDEYLPNLYDVKIKSHENELIGVMLTPGGKGPHPSVIVLHGFPGYEDNYDLAHSLRRCGMNVLRFHYRGSWGVKGTFSFLHCIEDVKEVIDFMTKNETIQKYNIDKDNIFMVGHSMGGFLTLTNCIDERIKASVVMSTYDFGLKGCVMKIDKDELQDGIEMFSGAIMPLNHTDTDSLIKEVIDNGEQWRLSNKAKELSKQNILMIAATKDIIAPNELHHIPLVSEIYKYNNKKVKEIFIDTDHSYNNKRIELAKLVANYIEEIYMEKI